MSNVNMRPAFERDNVAIAFAVDQNYVPYLKYAIKSVVANCKRGNLDIIVLHTGELDARAITGYFKGKPNLSIRFMDISDIVQREIAPYFVQANHLTMAATYRLFLPNLLPNYDKVIWLDTDIVVTGDIAELFGTELGDCWLGAVVDVGLENGLSHESAAWRRERGLRWAKKYNFEPWEGYFNSGVLLMNLAALREANVRKRLIEIAVDPYSELLDQDALNVVCRGHVKYLDSRWNFQVFENCGREMGEACIVHFVGQDKPWNSLKPDFSELWWDYVDDEDTLPLFKRGLELCAKRHKKELAALDEYYCKKLREMKHSVSYKLGRALTKPFRAIFVQFRRAGVAVPG